MTRSTMTRDRPLSPARSTAAASWSTAPGPTSASYWLAPAVIWTGRAASVLRSEPGPDEIGDDIGHLPWRAMVGLDDVMGTPVGGVALLAKLGQALGEVTVGQHRARLARQAARKPPGQRRWRTFEEDHQIAVEHPLAVRLGHRRAAARRDHLARSSAHLGDHLSLDRPKARLTKLGEDRLDRLALLALDLAVGVDESPAEPLRQEPPDRRLAGAAEADQDDVGRAAARTTRPPPPNPLP